SSSVERFRSAWRPPYSVERPAPSCRPPPRRKTARRSCSSSSSPTTSGSRRPRSPDRLRTRTRRPRPRPPLLHPQALRRLIRRPQVRHRRARADRARADRATRTMATATTPTVSTRAIRVRDRADRTVRSIRRAASTTKRAAAERARARPTGTAGRRSNGGRRGEPDDGRDARMEGHPEPDSATAGELPARLALRARIERFARSRAAHRALPVSAGSLAEAAEAERRAGALRQDLGRRSGLGDASEAFDSAWTGAVRSVDERLDAMDSDVLARVDRLDFPSLRAHLPRAIEAHRREGIALLDVMLGDRDGLPGRLDKVEYLVTLLSTEEMDGRRQIVHDPVTLTAGLARLVQEVPTPPDARAIAVEIHQAASL